MSHPDLLRAALRVLNEYAVTLPPPDLISAREALQAFMFDADGIQRDDVLNVCQKIDDELSAA
ncbi:MAG: hypothetical protein ABI885_22725 [Gammaproteobacteria bacterium]